MCDVSVVVGLDAELDELSVDDVRRTEDVIVSQWREISADEKHEMREKIDEILSPLGFETRLLVIQRANSIELHFMHNALSQIMSLRDQRNNEQVTDIVQKLFTFLSQATRPVRVKRLTWSQPESFRSLQGKQTS